MRSAQVVRGRLATLVVAVAGAVLLAACARPRRPPTLGPCGTTAPAVAPVETLAPEQRVAVDWIRRARAAEVGVTPQLVEIAEAQGGRMVGLEYKLKSLASTVSKLERLRARAPETPLEAIDVYDALRYTMAIPDAPPGKHDAAIRESLASLERAGHQIRKVKNYWPRGDSYSGTNCTLETRDGFPWELQFHTPRSYEAKSSVHADYTRMRDEATPIEERRRLYQQMTAMWEAIPIPDGILVPGSLHEREVIRTLPSP